MHATVNRSKDIEKLGKCFVSRPPAMVILQASYTSTRTGEAVHLIYALMRCFSNFSVLSLHSDDLLKQIVGLP